MTCVRFVMRLLKAPILLWLISGTALAAPPPNDTFPGATSVGLGFSETLDTSEATTDSDDAQLNASCGLPNTSASVWYAFTPDSDTEVLINTLGTSYPAGILVGVGTRGNLQLVTCTYTTAALQFSATAGTTYYVLVVDNIGLGGVLHISVEEAPPPPKVDISVNHFGQVDLRTGIATISGSYTCENGDYFDTTVDVSQSFGRLTLSGLNSFEEAGTCDNSPHTWSTDVSSSAGRFAGGKAQVTLNTTICGLLTCSFSSFQQTIQMRSGGR